VVIQQV